MTVYPCVKVNLGLNVLRKRPDGYHDLETLFVPSGEYHDVLEIIAGDDWSRTSASLFARYRPRPRLSRFRQSRNMNRESLLFRLFQRTGS